jgi:hypothetical protein
LEKAMEDAKGKMKERRETARKQGRIDEDD